MMKSKPGKKGQIKKNKIKLQAKVGQVAMASSDRKVSRKALSSCSCLTNAVCTVTHIWCVVELCQGSESLGVLSEEKSH